jgi:hypothetical protein
MFALSNHEEKANQNHSEIPPHTHQDSYFPNEASAEEGVEKLDPYVHCSWEYKIVRPLQKCGSSSKN